MTVTLNAAPPEAQAALTWSSHGAGAEVLYISVIAEVTTIEDAPVPRGRSRLRRMVRLSPAAVVVAVAMLVYGGVFGVLTWRQQSNFGEYGFDLGIYDQSIWLL